MSHKTGIEVKSWNGKRALILLYSFSRLHEDLEFDSKEKHHIKVILTMWLGALQSVSKHLRGAGKLISLQTSTCPSDAVERNGLFSCTYWVRIQAPPLLALCIWKAICKKLQVSPQKQVATVTSCYMVSKMRWLLILWGKKYEFVNYVFVI